MIRRDYHNHTLDQAVNDVDSIVSATRMSGKVEDCELIVGHGIIRNELIFVLKTYGFAPRIQLGNSGVIVCEIE